MSEQHIFRNLLDALPLHAEEGNYREKVTETALVASIQGGSIDANAAKSAVVVIRRMLESLSVLDPVELVAGHWAFVSFPASLMARSVLETLSKPETSFFAADYWMQGRNRPVQQEREQRELLRWLETQRASNPVITVTPIRTVHVTWGLIRLGGKFLLRRREDEDRPDVAGYVFPGGRLDLTDLPTKYRSSEALRDLFKIDSVLAQEARVQTLSRELREELGLLPTEYAATYQRPLQPFRKVEGTRNNHGYTQYDIAIYTVKLTHEGELKVLDRVASESSDWLWFSTADLAVGKRADGRSAFIDALTHDPSVEIKKYLSSDVPSSSEYCPAYRSKADAIELPPSAEVPIWRGDAGRQKPIRLKLDHNAWELLVLLGWHVRGLDVMAREGQVLNPLNLAIETHGLPSYEVEYAS